MPTSSAWNRDGLKVRLYNSAKAKYLAIFTERVPNIRPNFGGRLSLLVKIKTRPNSTTLPSRAKPFGKIIQPEFHVTNFGPPVASNDNILWCQYSVQPGLKIKSGVVRPGPIVMFTVFTMTFSMLPITSTHRRCCRNNAAGLLRCKNSSESLALQHNKVQ